MKLDYETVYRAVKGDHDAQEKLLQYYDAYISALSTVVEICSDGTEHQYCLLYTSPSPRDTR